MIVRERLADYAIRLIRERDEARDALQRVRDMLRRPQDAGLDIHVIDMPLFSRWLSELERTLEQTHQ